MARSEDGRSSIDATVVDFSIRYSLSRREQEILVQLARGVPAKSIGCAIGCGHATVRTHLRRVYKKLGCSGSLELLARLLYESAEPKKA